MKITRIAAAALLMAMAACSSRPEADATPPDQFTGGEVRITTRHLVITASGDPDTIRRYAPQLLDRIDAVPAGLIRPGIALWVEDEGEGAGAAGHAPLIRVGQVVAVEPRAGGY